MNSEHSSQCERTILAIKEQSLHVDKKFPKERQVLAIELRCNYQQPASMQVYHMSAHLLSCTIHFPDCMRASLIDFAAGWVVHGAISLLNASDESNFSGHGRYSRCAAPSWRQ